MSRTRTATASASASASAVEAPVADTPDALVAEYPTADTRRKSAIRTHVQNALVTAMDEGDFEAALAWRAAQKSLAPAAPARVEIDWQALTTQRVVDLRAAADMIEAGHLPEGVPSEFVYVTPDGVSVTYPQPTEAATTLASARIARRDRTTDLEDIQGVLDRAFADQPVGTFLKVSEIAKFHPRGNQAGGAITARVKGWDGTGEFVHTLTGVVPVDRDPSTGTARGFRKIEA